MHKHHTHTHTHYSWLLTIFFSDFTVHYLEQLNTNKSKSKQMSWSMELAYCLVKREKRFRYTVTIYLFIEFEIPHRKNEVCLKFVAVMDTSLLRSDRNSSYTLTSASILRCEFLFHFFVFVFVSYKSNSKPLARRKKQPSCRSDMHNMPAILMLMLMLWCGYWLHFETHLH